MKTTTTLITKLIVAKTTTIEGHPGIKTVFKAGRVLETVKHKNNHYYPWKYVITLGHGMNEVIPVENLKVKWFEETKTVTLVDGARRTEVKMVEVPVTPYVPTEKEKKRAAKEAAAVAREEARLAKIAANKIAREIVIKKAKNLGLTKKEIDLLIK